MSGQQTRSRWPDSAVIFVVPASEDADRNRAVGTEVNVVSPNSLRRLEGMTARPSSGLLALPTMTNFGSWKGYMQVCGPRFNRCHGAVELYGDEREALPGFRHRAQCSVVFFRPSFVLLTGKHSRCL